MEENNIISLFEQVGAIVKGHYILSSGRHSEDYVDKDTILRDPRYLMMLAGEMALRIRHLQFTVVCGPYWGGGMLAQAVGIALELNLGRRVTIAAIKANSGGFRHGLDGRVAE